MRGALDAVQHVQYAGLAGWEREPPFSCVESQNEGVVISELPRSNHAFATKGGSGVKCGCAYVIDAAVRIAFCVGSMAGVGVVDGF